MPFTRAVGCSVAHRLRFRKYIHNEAPSDRPFQFLPLIPSEVLTVLGQARVVGSSGTVTDAEGLRGFAAAPAARANRCTMDAVAGKAAGVQWGEWQEKRSRKEHV